MKYVFEPIRLLKNWYYSPRGIRCRLITRGILYGTLANFLFIGIVGFATKLSSY